MLGDDFKTFCENIELDNEEEFVTSAGEIAKKLNKSYYDLDGDTESHLYIVGSVERGTAIKGSSDLDILFNLPQETYRRFDGYVSNGQSALLQEVKEVLQERYPRTEISGDGQVVVIEFDKYTVELVPGFQQFDDSFRYPDTHDGGSWKKTDPLPEQDECKACNDRSGGIYYDFCHILRAWKNSVGFKMGGLLIDTLVYNYFSEHDDYSDKGYDDYYDILVDVFDNLQSEDKDQKYWFAIGSNQKVYNSANGAFVKKAKDAYERLDDADEGDLNETIRDILRDEFPVRYQNISEGVQYVLEKSAYSDVHNYVRGDSTEEFIEERFGVDIRYMLFINCRVTQDGFRPFELRDAVYSGKPLKHNKNLDFFIKTTDCPEPYDIYWKVRIVGDVARDKSMIRGQINKGREHHNERTNFRGPHYVECYLVKNGVCVARDRIDVPIE